MNAVSKQDVEEFVVALRDITKEVAAEQIKADAIDLIDPKFERENTLTNVITLYGRLDDEKRVSFDKKHKKVGELPLKDLVIIEKQLVNYFKKLEKGE